MKPANRVTYRVLAPMAGFLTLLVVGTGFTEEVDWHQSDSNNDGIVDFEDLFIFMTRWQEAGVSPQTSGVRH